LAELKTRSWYNDVLEGLVSSLSVLKPSTEMNTSSGALAKLIENGADDMTKVFESVGQSDVMTRALTNSACSYYNEMFPKLASSVLSSIIEGTYTENTRSDVLDAAKSLVKLERTVLERASGKAKIEHMELVDLMDYYTVVCGRADMRLKPQLDLEEERLSGIIRKYGSIESVRSLVDFDKLNEVLKGMSFMDEPRDWKHDGNPLIKFLRKQKNIILCPAQSDALMDTTASDACTTSYSSQVTTSRPLLLSEYVRRHLKEEVEYECVSKALHEHMASTLREFDLRLQFIIDRVDWPAVKGQRYFDLPLRIEALCRFVKKELEGFEKARKLLRNCSPTFYPNKKRLHDGKIPSFMKKHHDGKIPSFMKKHHGRYTTQVKYPSSEIVEAWSDGLNMSRRHGTPFLKYLNDGLCELLARLVHVCRHTTDRSATFKHRLEFVFNTYKFPDVLQIIKQSHDLCR